MQLKIEDGIPIPSRRGRGGRGSQLVAALTKMQPGQSVLTDITNASNVHMYACIAGVSVKTCAEGDGRRVWLIGKRD
jgi:dUTPase